MERKADGLDEWTDLLVCEGLNGWRKKIDLSSMDGWTDWMAWQGLNGWIEKCIQDG